MMQAWLDTLENPEDSNNIDFMAWVSDRRGEFLKTGMVPKVHQNI